MTDKKIFLENKLNDVMHSCTGNLKYYHYRTIKNYIYYLDKFYTEENREKIFEQINEYLDVLKNEPNPDRKAAIEYFNKYVKPISIYYAESFSFVSMIDFRIALFYMFGLFLLERFLQFSNIAIIISMSLIGVYLLFIFYKKMKKKVYGFMW